MYTEIKAKTHDNGRVTYIVWIIYHNRIGTRRLAEFYDFDAAMSFANNHVNN